MEYASTASYERLTGRTLFTPNGQGNAIDLGNITAIKDDYGAKTAEVMLNVRGKQILGRRDVYGVVPVYTVSGDQFATPIVPLLILGQQNADFSQSSGTAATFVFTAVKGGAWPIGAYNVNSVVVTDAGTKVLGTDYFLDPYNGIISLPVLPAGIADGDTVTVTFNKPALTMEDYTAFTTLNRAGTMVMFLEDEYGPPAKEIWTASVQVSMKKSTDRDPTKFAGWDMEISVFGNPDIKKRKT